MLDTMVDIDIKYKEESYQTDTYFMKSFFVIST